MRISPESIRQNPMLHLLTMLAACRTRESLDRTSGYADALRDLPTLRYPDWLEVRRKISNLNVLVARPMRRRRVTLLRVGRI